MLASSSSSPATLFSLPLILPPHDGGQTWRGRGWRDAAVDLLPCLAGGAVEVAEGLLELGEGPGDAVGAALRLAQAPVEGVVEEADHDLVVVLLVAAAELWHQLAAGTELELERHASGRFLDLAGEQLAVFVAL